MVVQRPNDCEWVSRGAIAPDPPEGIDGCRESEISSARGQPPIRLHGENGLNAQVTPSARGMQRESASVSLAKMVLSDNTHLAERDKSLFSRNSFCRDGSLNRPKEPLRNERMMLPSIAAEFS